MEGKLQFADLEAVGPGTPAGRYLRRFWHPVLRARTCARARPSRSKSWAKNSRSTAAKAATFHLCVTSAARIAARSSRSAGSRATTSAAAITAGASTARGQCVEQPDVEQSNAHRVKMPVYPTREYLGLVFAYIGEGAPPTFPQLSRPRPPGRRHHRRDRDHPVQLLEPARQRHQPHPVGASRHRAAQGPQRLHHPAQGDGRGNALRLEEHALRQGRDRGLPRHVGLGAFLHAERLSVRRAHARARVSRAATCGTPRSPGRCRSTTRPSPPST